MKSIITIATVATLLLTSASPSWAQEGPNGIKLFSSSPSGVYSYALVASGGLKFLPIGGMPGDDTWIVLSGLSNVDGARLVGDLDDPTGNLGGKGTDCFFQVSFTDTSVTMTNLNALTCTISVDTPTPIGYLQVFTTSNSTIVGTVEFQLEDTNVGNGTISGTTQGQVPPLFAGAPNVPDCVQNNISDLERQFDGIGNAAKALGFRSVSALRKAVLSFCRS